MDEATEPRTKLDVLLHLFENFLRLATAIAIGDLRQRHTPAPERVAQTLLLGMTNPTLDTWRQLCAQAARFLDAESIAPGLPADIARLGELATEVRKRRNDAAHALVGTSWARETVDMLMPRIADALNGVTWLRDLELVARSGNSRFPIAGDGRVAAANVPDDVVVEAHRAGRSVELFPFIVIVTTSTTSGVGVCRSLMMSWDGIEAYDLGSDGRPSRIKRKGDARLESFRTWCRYSDRMALLGMGATSKDWTRVRRIFGREPDLQGLADAIQQHRVTWVEGPAGIGKSLLLEHVARNHRVRGGELVYWRFITNEPVPSLVLYKHLAEKLKPRDAHVPRLGDDANAWLRHLQLLVEETPPAPTLLVLDALDEATSTDIARLPFVLASEPLKWICSGRPTEDLRAVFADDQCHRYELARLADVAVRRWLEVEAPTMLADAERVERAAQGLPVYLRVVVSEYEAGRLQPGEALPKPNDDFWKQAIRRGAAASPAVARWFLDILQVVAQAVEAPTAALVRDVLSCAGTLALDDHDVDAEFDRALDATSSLLTNDETAGGATVLRPVHALLVEVLRSEREYRHSLRQARTGLLKCIEQPPSVLARSYANRAGIRQLVALQEVERAVALLGDYDWIRMRLFESDGAEPAQRIAQVVADLDLVSQLAMHSELEALRSFLASNGEVIRDAGEPYFYQSCANGDLGAYWRERGAIPWATRQGQNFRTWWLEVAGIVHGVRDVTPLIEMTLPQMAAGSETDRRRVRRVRSMVFEPDGRHLLMTYSEGAGLRWDTRTGEQWPQENIRGRLIGFDSGGELWAVADDRLDTFRRADNTAHYRGVESREFTARIRGCWPCSNGFILSLQDGVEYRLVAVPSLQVVSSERYDDVQLSRASALKGTEPPVGHLIAPNSILVGHGLTEEGEINVFQGALTQRGPMAFVNVSGISIVESARQLVCIPLMSERIELFDIDTMERKGTIEIPRYEGNRFVRHSTGLVAGVVVFVEAGGPLIFYNVDTQQAVATSRPHLGWCNALALSLDASLLATSDDDEVKVWRCGELIASSPTAPAPEYPVVMLAVADGADRVACLEYEGDLRIYEFGSGRHLRTASRFGRPYSRSNELMYGAERYCTISSNGRRIATVDWDGFRILDLVSDRTYYIAFEEDAEHDPRSLDTMRLNGDGTILSAVHESHDYEEVAWDVETGRRVSAPSIEEPQPTYRAEWDDRLVRFIDVTSNSSATWRARESIDIATIAADGRTVIATSDGSVAMLRLRRGGIPRGLRLVES